MATGKAGKIVIISSPSGGGKTSICRRLLADNADDGWEFSISYTTRSMRPGEKSGREYYFVSESEFDNLAEHDFFAEHCGVHLYKYGTPREPLEKVLESGGVMLLDVDVQGAERLKAAYPQAITIFVLPPSVDALRSRLKARGTETDEQLQVRFRNATDEMKLWRRFQYAVINEELESAVGEVRSIIGGHHCRTDQMDPEQIENMIG